ncbi:MAG TPA: alpha/beta hydrolase [Candidatus Saccharimonadales bacterium]|nr:alpha/beta hydrolase [Candidatus Saccharimonadales bacterium]
MIPLPKILNVKHNYIKINGTQIHIAKAGQGKPLLLLHGWPQHWYVWRKVIPELAENYELLMPDLPGFGWSDIPKDNDFHKEKLASDIIHLIDILHLKHVGLIGHDWGGWIGFLMCIQKPELFSSYLALGIGYPFSTHPIGTLQKWRFFYQLPIATPVVGETLLKFWPQLTEWGIKQCAYQKDLWTKKELNLYSNVLQNTDRAKASSLLYRTFLTRELPVIKKYRHQTLLVPSQLLIGKNDPIINPLLFRGIKQKNLSINYIKNCGHFIPEEQPERVIKEIKELFI